MVETQLLNMKFVLSEEKWDFGRTEYYYKSLEEFCIVQDLVEVAIRWDPIPCFMTRFDVFNTNFYFDKPIRNITLADIRSYLIIHLKNEVADIQGNLEDGEEERFLRNIQKSQNCLKCLKRFQSWPE